MKPEILVCLGATAAKSIFGSQFRLTEQRGQFLQSKFSPRTIATYHPPQCCAPTPPESREQLYKILRDDLALIASTPVTHKK